MRVLQGRLLAIGLLVVLSTTCSSQEVPKATPEGQKALDALLVACEADSGLVRAREGPKVVWRVDPEKLRKTLVQRKEDLTPELRDALMAAVYKAGVTPALESERGKLLAVLTAVGEEAMDARASGFAAFFRGYDHKGRMQLAEAAMSFEKAARQFALVPDLAWQALSLNNLGAVLQDQGEYGKALGFFEQALEMRRQLYSAERYPQGHPDLTNCLNNLGAVLQAQGEYDKALGFCERALDMYRKLYPAERYPQGHPDLALSLNNLGAVLQAQGEYGKALSFHEQALQMSRSSSALAPLQDAVRAAPLLLPQPNTVLWLQNRAYLMGVLLTPRSSAQQVRDCDQAFALTLAVQQRLLTDVLQRDDSKLLHGEKTANVIPLRLGLARRLFDLEHKPDDLVRAFQTLERGRAQVFLENLGQANASRLAGLPKDQRDKEESLRRTIRLIDAELRTIATLPGDQAAARRLELNAQRHKAEDDFLRFEHHLKDTNKAYADLRYPEPCSVKDARLCLDDNEVALLFAVGADASYVLVLHKRPRPDDPALGLAIIALPGSKAFATKIEAITSRGRLEAPNGTQDLGLSLYRDLLAPLAEHIRGKDLVLVPDGPLCALPFELLVEGADGKDPGRYLIEGHRIRYAPSMTTLHVIRQWEDGRKIQPDRPLLAFGDPVFDPKDDRLKPGTQLTQSTLAVLRSLGMREGPLGDQPFARLPASGQEVCAIADVLQAKDCVFTDARASEQGLKRLSADKDLARARYVHLATHGILGFDRGQGPALVLSQVGTSGVEDEFGRDDGYLTLPEVSALKLNADLVVLSACRTGQGRMHSGEGVNSIARVFFYAGCRGVVCSLWSVDDEATSDLMKGIYQRLQKGQGSADALREAKLAMIEDGYAPLYWAPFVYVGR